MVQTGANRFILAATCVLLLAITPAESKGRKRHQFYALVPKDLRTLAEAELETLVQLETFKKNGQAKLWSSSNLKFVDK